jgi:hypothetical protein
VDHLTAATEALAPYYLFGARRLVRLLVILVILLLVGLFSRNRRR